MSEEVKERKKPRNPKPLRLLVHPTIWDAPEVREMHEKGHHVAVMDDHLESLSDPASYDLILGPNCWRMDSRLIKHLDAAVKNARVVKYQKKEKVSDGVSAE